MEDTALGITLGIAIKGITGLSTLNNSFKQISASLQKAGANVSTLNAKIANLGSATKSINLAKARLDDEFAKIPSALAKLGTLSVPVKLAVDYESAMVDVKKYIEFESEEQFAKMSADIKTLGATMLSVGKAPEVASTALNSLYNSLANIDGVGAKFHKGLEKIGLDATELKVKLRVDSAGAVQEFSGAIARLDKEAQMGVLTDMFGKQFSDDIGSLVSNADILANAFSLIKENSADSLDEAMDLKLSTAKSGFERLKISLLNLGASIGEAFLPLSNFLADFIAKIASTIDGFVNKHSQYVRPILGVVSAFLAWGVIAPVIRILANSFLIMFHQIRAVIGVFRILTTIFNLKYLATIRLNLAYALSAIRLRALGAASVVANTATKAFAFTSTALSKALNFLKISLFSAVRGGERLSLSGQTLPKKEGKYRLYALYALAELRTALPLISGRGEYFGRYYIKSIKETRSVWDKSGGFLVQEFSIELEKHYDLGVMI